MGAILSGKNMSTMIVLGRLGRDCELSYTPQGQAVARIAFAYNYGRKDNATGKKTTQWVDATLFGTRAESLSEYLTKGSQFLFFLDEVHVNTYEKTGGGTGVSLRGIISKLEFAGGGNPENQGSRQQAAPQNNAETQQPQTQQQPAGFDGFDDDIPF